MTNYEKEFDVMIQDYLPDLPPQEIVKKVTPWRKAINRILVGIAMHTIVINEWKLNYILPMIGIVLMLLGFRTLRQENKWFKTCWYLVILQTFYHLFVIITCATVYQNEIYAFEWMKIVSYAMAFLEILVLVCLWQAFKEVKCDMNLPENTGSAVALIIWYVVITFLALSEIEVGMFFFIVIGVAYGFIIRSLYLMSKELDEAGYGIKAASNKLSDRCVVFVIASVIIIGFMVSYSYLNSYPMEWTVAETAEQGEITEIKDQLLELGFPKNVLEDLAVEEIEMCEGALQVVTNTKSFQTGDNENEEEEIRITNVAVKIPGEYERWKSFHHFSWTDETMFYGTEAILLWSSILRNEVCCVEGEVTGQILYDEEDVTYRASYYSIDSLSENTSKDVFAEFSMPNDVENRRGYVSFTLKMLQENHKGRIWINYIHQDARFQYPVLTAKDGEWYEFPFEAVQYDMSFETKQ